MKAPDDFARLSPHLTAVKLPRSFVVAEPDEPVRKVYFIEQGVSRNSFNAYSGDQRFAVGAMVLLEDAAAEGAMAEI